MEFKITFKNQFKALDFILFLFLITIGCIIYFHYTNPFFYIEIFVWIFLIQLLPVIYLHIEYLLLNSKMLLKMNCQLSFLKYTAKNNTKSLDFNQISKISLYLPPSAYRGMIERKMQFLPIEPYGYAIIYSVEGDKIIVTSLMIPDLYTEFSKLKLVSIDKNKRLIASPSLEKVIQWFKKDGL